MFAMSFTANNEISPAVMSLVHAVSAKIVDVLEAKKEIVKNAESIDNVTKDLQKNK
jgi:hypothetical protein